ncbi:MAG: Eco57I restriction-modification methylase domain-containing protein, partial [Sulfuricurvum sp.]
MFHLKTLQRYAEAQDQTLLTSRFEALQRYKAKAFEIQKLIEQKYQEGFLRDIFVSALGYTLQPDTPYNLAREEKNEQDAKKADGSIIVDGHIIALIELKDLSTKDLDRAKTRNDKSAVEQLFGYVTSHNHARYGIVSNFNELRFYFDKKTEYRRFELFSMEFEEFKVFHLLLSFESIKNGVPLTLKEESASEEQKISKTLYSDFSIFRTHLFENILKNNDMERSLLLRLTQKLCDRIIFILFAEDRALLKKETIKEIRTRHANDGFGDRSMYDYYKLYFNAINMGNDKLGIPKYNGGLFATDEFMDSLIIDDAYLDVEVQGLSNYNFMTDIGVNILGHIFEQSLTDLEELNASINDMEFDKKKSKRKKDGVFYTPEYITRYIVENTLGRLCADKRHQLALDVEVVPPVNFKKLSKIEQTIFDNLKAYRTWLLELKICDPACGSGAFLNQALEFLIREHKNVDEYRRLYESEALILYDIETNILEHNLYGVDINEDAVEIARLSLWLRTAHKGRELTSLNDKIVCANSLLAMPFEKNSFDVVIGNPPYVALNKIKDVDYSHSGFEVFEKTGDLLALFIEKGLGLTADGKYFSFIVS